MTRRTEKNLAATPRQTESTMSHSIGMILVLAGELEELVQNLEPEGPDINREPDDTDQDQVLSGFAARTSRTVDRKMPRLASSLTLQRPRPGDQTQPVVFQWSLEAAPPGKLRGPADRSN
jgi:hypothetical protein